MPGGRPRKKRTGPKKPLSAYTLFVVEVRNNVQRDNPHLSFKEVASKVGAMWRELPEHHKEKYQQLAEQDKVRYDREKEEWRIRAQNAPPEEDKQKRKKRKGAPKNNLSAYTYYIMDVRKDVQLNNPHMSFKEVAQHVGQMWRNLDVESRAIYTQKAESDKARYENDMIEWNTRLQAEAAEAALESKGKKKKKMGPKNPLSAYTYFVMENRPLVSVDNPKLSFGEVAAKVGVMWRALSPEERVKYDTLAAEDKDRYEREKESLKQRLQHYQTHQHYLQ